MNHLAIIISLIVSLITCSFIAGLCCMYWASANLWHFTYYTLEGLIEAYYMTLGIEVLTLIYLPTVAITYYMITD